MLRKLEGSRVPIIYEVRLGGNIQEAVRHLLNVAVALGARQYLLFNGVIVNVGPEDTPEKVIRRYWEAMGVEER